MIDSMVVFVHPKCVHKLGYLQIAVDLRLSFINPIQAPANTLVAHCSIMASVPLRVAQVLTGATRRQYRLKEQAVRAPHIWFAQSLRQASLTHPVVCVLTLRLAISPK